MKTPQPEVWQRGPLPGIPALLQPVAHALVQAVEEVDELMRDFPAALLWERPANLASAGFHLHHLRGVLDRVFTYARNEGLTEAQFNFLSGEGKDTENGIQTQELVEAFEKQVGAALEQLKNTSEAILTDYRGVGRAGLPSTVIGLLVHAAEHTMRHIGQLLVTVAVVKQAAGLDESIEDQTK
ncbi:MAG: DinB family protein [Ferruginibacter sp.]|nr:DinB family protein [Ferruginibacter sp.]